MNEIENAVAGHYGDSALLTRILTALEKSGVDTKFLSADDLAPVDEFHIGGRAATEHALAQIPLSKDNHVLDIGCGIGGAARTIATQIGCRVTGIDLTPEFIEVAKVLTNLTRLTDHVSFETANALAMPFEDKTFEAAITLHVAMNISDRAALYAEIARVLKPGATLCIYDVMKMSDDDITFPVPWAQTSQTSHLTTPDEMQVLLSNAGFEISDVEERTKFAIEFFRQRLISPDRETPPLGTQLIMGADTSNKFKNVQNNIERGCIAPVQMIALKSV